MPVREKWWTHCIGSDEAPYYDTAANAKAGKSKGKKGYFIWGDRVRVLEGDPDADKTVRVGGRGVEMHVQSKYLNGEPLLEIYVIDVGQGDGLLVVTPEGHHIVIDAGNLRQQQKGGMNSADFIDWKFYKDYLDKDKRGPNVPILLDAVMASHCDQDHFGGLLDLLALETPKNKAELDCATVQVDNFYHAGLSWWFKFNSARERDRTLSTPVDGAYVKLLGDRASATDAVARMDDEDPGENSLSGSWGKFVRAMTKTRRASSNGYAKITRLSNKTHKYLPGFGKNDPSSVKVRVLGPVELDIGGQPGLQVYPDGDSKNTNGHSIVLRLDYGDRRILLTGDLNTSSQHQLMETYGNQFAAEFGCDVAKGCHHGSHDVSYRFLDGLKPLGTVISSGDGETHDHPRPTIVSASALTGRRLLSEDGDRLIAPLVYVTEVARSTDLGDIVELREFEDPQPEYTHDKPTTGATIHKDEALHRFRLILEKSPKSSFDWPRLDVAKAVKGITYGLVNVRTDGKRLFFAVKEETGPDWGIQVLEADEIERAQP